jgi:RNA polymerase sigma factor (TIGR02999 family)
MSQNEPELSSVAQLLSDVRSGNKELADQLVEAFYGELRRLAAAKMRSERTEHTWQPTVLVNELYLELMKVKELKVKGSSPVEGKQAFIGLAAYLMNRLLIHHARPLSSRVSKIAIDEYVSDTTVSHEALEGVEQLLVRLAGIDPRLRTLVEMKVFEGMSVDEIAERLKCSPRTVARQWRFAKEWLRDQLARN